jgi:hypothetical protein
MLSFYAGALMVPSRNPASCMARTCAFQSVWLVRTSFSETGMKEIVVEAKLEVTIVRTARCDLCGGVGSNYHAEKQGTKGFV